MLSGIGDNEFSYGSRMADRLKPPDWREPIPGPRKRFVIAPAPKFREGQQSLALVPYNPQTRHPSPGKVQATVVNQTMIIVPYTKRPTTPRRLTDPLTRSLTPTQALSEKCKTRTQATAATVASCEIMTPSSDHVARPVDRPTHGSPWASPTRCSRYTPSTGETLWDSPLESCQGSPTVGRLSCSPSRDRIWASPSSSDWYHSTNIERTSPLTVQSGISTSSTSFKYSCSGENTPWLRTTDDSDIKGSSGFQNMNETIAGARTPTRKRSRPKSEFTAHDARRYCCSIRRAVHMLFLVLLLLLLFVLVTYDGGRYIRNCARLFSSVDPFVCLSKPTDVDRVRFAESLSNHLFGQEVAKEIIGERFDDVFDRSPVAGPVTLLVFQGGVGTGKTMAADIVGKSLFPNDPGNCFEQFTAASGFDERSVVVGNLMLKLNDSLTPTVHVFDDCDNLPPQFATAIAEIAMTLFPARHTFIFVTNRDSDTLMDYAISNYLSGDMEHDVGELLTLLNAVADDADGSFISELSRLLTPAGLLTRVPFLPLSRNQVRQCIEKLLLLLPSPKPMTRATRDIVVERVMDHVDFHPKNLRLFAGSGCKRLQTLVDLYRPPLVTTDSVTPS